MNDTQKACPHVFVGRADGVHWTRCGLHLTAQQYRELLHPLESPQNAPSDAGDKELTEPDKTAQTATEPPHYERIAKAREAKHGRKRSSQRDQQAGQSLRDRV